MQIDDRDDRSPGYKFNHWELKGVPIRIEIGPRDLAADQAVVVTRDTRERFAGPLDQLLPTITEMLDDMQHRLFDAAKQRLADLTGSVQDYEALKSRVAENAGWNRVQWCGDARCETTIKNDTRATIRCIPLDQEKSGGPCIVCGTPETRAVIVARAY